MMTQLRFAIPNPEGPDAPQNLETLWCDLRTELSDELRELLRPRLRNGDVFALRWSHLVCGERISSSTPEHSPLRIQAAEPTLKSLVEAIEADEQRMRSTPNRTYSVNALV
jgi:hypothetical protein